jgi:G3E family GTPase
MTAPTPLVLLTGPLGSGKSTLLKALLADPDMADTALVINEFGAVGLDHLLVASAVETTLLLENGCVCCALRGDLVDTLAALLDQRDAGRITPFRRIVVETTGLADPAPIVRELAAARNLDGRVVLRRVVTAVDAALGFDPAADAALGQIVQADRLVITKADLAAPIAVDRLRERLAQLNPAAAVEVARDGRIAAPAALFLDDQSLGGVGPRPCAAVGGEDRRHHRHHHHHGADHGAADHGGVDSWATRLDRPLPWALVGAWLDLLYSLRPGHLLRMKGVLWITEADAPLLTQAVGPLVAPPEFLPAWPGGVRETRLVVIARDLSARAVAASFEAEVLARAAAPRRAGAGRAGQVRAR